MYLLILVYYLIFKDITYKNIYNRCVFANNIMTQYKNKVYRYSKIKKIFCNIINKSRFIYDIILLIITFLYHHQMPWIHLQFLHLIYVFLHMIVYV